MDSEPRVSEASFQDTSSCFYFPQFDGGEVSGDQVKCVPPGVNRDINMLLHAKTVNQTQELNCKTTGGVVDMYIHITNNVNVG